MGRSFRIAQIRTMILCWLVYAIVYFGRLNLSVAIPELQLLTGSDKSQIGLIGTLFFWFYGVGQLLGGTLGDRVPIRKLVFFGLSASALCNLFFGLTDNLLWMYVLWACNGIFQSLIWCPLVKTIARWIAPERRSSVMVAVSTSMVGGFLLAWGLLGRWVGQGSVRLLFVLPAISMAAVALLWFLLMRDRPEDAGFPVTWVEEAVSNPKDCAACSEQTDAVAMQPVSEGKGSGNAISGAPEGETKAERKAAFWRIAVESRLWLIILACFAQGIVRDGITLWAPTFFMEAHGMSLKQATSSILFLPAMNFGGILLSGWLTEKLNKRVEAATAFMFLAAMALLGGMIGFGGTSPVVAVVFLGLISGMMYGVNTLLLGVVPLQFEKYGRSSSFSGLLNFLAYMASGMASAFTGLLVDLSGWNGVLVSWVVLAAVGTVALFAHEAMKSRDRRKEAHTPVVAGGAAS